MDLNSVQSVVLTVKQVAYARRPKTMNEKKDTKNSVADEPHIVEYWVQKNVRGELELDDDSELRIVSTQRNLVSNYFYDLLQRGTVYGLNVSIQDNRVTRFRVLERVIIEENENYYDVKCTMDTLNELVTNNNNNYSYTGQPLQTLAHEYYMNNYDNHI